MELDIIIADAFKTLQKDVLFFTKDGNVFCDKTYADNHAALTKQVVITIKKQDYIKQKTAVISNENKKENNIKKRK